MVAKEELGIYWIRLPITISVSCAPNSRKAGHASYDGDAWLRCIAISTRLGNLIGCG